MNINRNVSVWRGNQYPPTNYHVWIKESGDVYVNINGTYVLQISPALGDTINVSVLSDNYNLILQDAINWLTFYGVKDLNLNIHKGTKIKFKEDKWKEYIYLGNNEDLKDPTNWAIITTEGQEEDIQDQISKLRIIEKPTSSNSEYLTTYELYNREGKQLGETIKIPKDKSIKDVQIADTNATIDDEGNIVEGLPKGNTALCIVYILGDGSYKLVKIDYQSFLEEHEFVDGLQVINHEVSVKIDPATEQFISTSSNGIKISGLKQSVDRVNSIWKGNPELVVPILSGTWVVYKADNSVVSPTPSFPLEYGYKAKYTGTWKWNSAEGRKNAERTTGTWGTTLPKSGVSSDSFTSPDYITDNITYSQSVYAKKLGLMIDGSNVIPAIGEDVKSASTNITFSNRIYYGISASKTPTESIIKSLTSVLGGKNKTITNITTDSTQYYYYAYPKSLGTLSTIIQDGAQPVLGAFTPKELTITNTAGIQITLYVYISNNPGAFTNNTLKFE